MEKPFSISANENLTLRFHPGWWLPGRHLQTLWPRFVRRQVAIHIRRERFQLPDGDFLDLDWVGSQGPIVIVLHGLQGSIRSPYTQGLLHALAQRNWRGVLMHFRGCSGEPNRLPRSYHSGETGDLGYVVASLRRRYPNERLAAVGYSMGGNVLLKWLGEIVANTPLACAVAVSVPFDLAKAIDYMERGWARMYQRHMVRSLSAALRLKMKTVSLDLDIKPHDVSLIRTFRDFDNQVTAPLHGFRNASDYYQRSSCRPWLRHIATPTLIVQAQNDPFIPADVIPQADEVSALVQLDITSQGGHVGFVAGSRPWRPIYWLEQRIPSFLAVHLDC